MDNAENCLENTDPELEEAPPTHIIRYKATSQWTVETEWLLYRASDGMYLAQSQGVLVLWGPDKNRAEGRLFMTVDHAHTYMEKLAEADLQENPQGDLKLKIEYVNNEKTILMPGETMIMPGPKSVRERNQSRSPKIN